MGQTPDESGPLPPDLRFLKTLVTVLTATMIIGLLSMVAIFVIRLQPIVRAPLPLPNEITLPEGVIALSVSYGPDFYAVVTDDRRILVFGADGEQRQSIAIK
jgi:hypothetical protein